MTTPAVDPRILAAVGEHFRLAREPGIGQVSNADEVVLSPDGCFVAFTGLVHESVGQDAIRSVRVLDLAAGHLLPVGSRYRETYSPRWSRDGASLGWIGSDGYRSVVEVNRWHSPATADGVPLPIATTVEVPGTVEFFEWSPSGQQLLLGVAEDGAEQSDVVGSGRLAMADAGPSWLPTVSVGVPREGWRAAWRYVFDTGEAEPINDVGLNVWQAAWIDETQIVLVGSDGPSESDWYGAFLAVTSLQTRNVTRLPTPPGQLAEPSASPSGHRVSVLVGLMSDRGVHSGDVLVLDPATGGGSALDVGGVDVSGVAWVDDDTLALAGLSGVGTCVSEHVLSTSSTHVRWRPAQTCGGFLPAASVNERGLAAVVHGYGHPPQVMVIDSSGVETRYDLAHPGSDFVAAAGGRLEVVRWLAADSWEIEGLLALPPGPGPYPLVVHLHGGPVWAWRDEWSMHYPHTPLLVERGYAVLHANSRGSVGRGQDVIRSGLMDMGALDAQDIVLGVDSLVDRGIADSSRVGVMGNSYGGFMAAWLAATTTIFAAAVCRSPVTEWVSQHHTSNIPGFDDGALTGDPLDVASHYRSRSPLFLAASVETPVLLIAGALDLATPADQAVMFHRALVERGKDSTLVVYPQEGHGIRHHDAMLDHLGRMIEFLEARMPASRSTAPGQ